jgi:hypothetical protein
MKLFVYAITNEDDKHEVWKGYECDDWIENWNN